jgi:DNA invertase Pin-like site-specific DNA recombinase
MREKAKAVERKPTAIIYIRMSTQYQVQMDSNSAEMQRAACMRICEQNDLRVSKVIEQVKSGKLYRKDLFNVINNEMRAGDCIVVYSITRFARKQLHAHNLIDLLKRKKCRLISASEDIDTAKDDKLLGLFAWLAEMESAQISERVKSSIEAKKERLEHVGGMPYGYMYSVGKGSPLVINEKEMEVVVRMRKMRNEDKMSFLKIARALNVEGIPSPKKQIIGGWSEMTVKRISERDESTILTKGKRSWYVNQQLHQIQNQGAPSASYASSSTEIVHQESDDESDDEQSEEETEIDDKDEEPIVENAPAKNIETSMDNSKALNALNTRLLPVLRALVMKKKSELGLTDEEIRNMSRDDLILILT